MPSEEDCLEMQRMQPSDHKTAAAAAASAVGREQVAVTTDVHPPAAVAPLSGSWSRHRLAAAVRTEHVATEPAGMLAQQQRAARWAVTVALSVVCFGVAVPPDAP